MKSKIRLRLAALALAGTALVGANVVADAQPAEAASGVHYCNWPNRVRFGWTGQATVKAYSPGGTFLGSRTNSWAGYWYTPWEDVRYTITGAATYSVACYY